MMINRKYSHKRFIDRVSITPFQITHSKNGLILRVMWYNKKSLVGDDTIYIEYKDLHRWTPVPDTLLK